MAGLSRQFQYEQGQQHPHGLPHVFEERRPETNFSAGPLPGRVVRGFTGHKSGVGKDDELYQSQVYKLTTSTGGGAWV